MSLSGGLTNTIVEGDKHLVSLSFCQGKNAVFWAEMETVGRKDRMTYSMTG